LHLIYYDEVKYDPPKQSSYWMGGICVSHEIVPDLEAQMSEIAVRAFGSATLNKDTEIHGIELCRGSGNFKARDFGARLALLTDLLAIIAREDVARIRIKVNPANILHAADSPSDIAFMFLVEKADALLTEKKSLGMLIGDYDEPAIGTSVSNLSEFRRGSTRWARGKGIRNLVDTVHFAKSHHSRMIQLADVFLYCSQFYWGANASGWRKAIAEVIRASGAMFPTKYKDWPGEARWYR
jgi:Protein of unknown function (DUF3800)